MRKHKYKLSELNGMLNLGMSVYEYYYPILTGLNLRPLDKKMKSPFLRNGKLENDPSFSIFMHRSKGTLFFKDHGTDQIGTHWQFVMDAYGIDFQKAVDKVKQDILGIKCDADIPNIPVRRADHQVIKKSARVEINPLFREFDDADLTWFRRFNILPATLENFHCNPLAAFDIKKDDKSIRISAKANSPIYNFAFPSGHCKNYQPFAEDPRHKWSGNLDPEVDVFGLDLVPKECEHLFLIGGNKDTMSFHETIGMPVIALSSESANLTESLYHFLNRIAKHIWVFYDNDKQGYDKARKFEEQYRLPSLNHLLAPFEVKDFSQLVDEKREAIPVFQKNLLQNINKTYININN